jgi:uncharacterized protein YyaL (SSP411 family)
MCHPEGGFFSAEDADSPRPEHPAEHGEGAFYVWTKRELTETLGEELGEIIGYAYGVSEGGNVEHDPHNEFKGKNILYLAHGTGEICERFRITGDALETLLAEARERMLKRRNGRPRPLRDDKIITSWNGLMISAYAIGGRVLGEPVYIEAAERAAGFLERHLLDRSTGRLLRRFRDGEARFPGHLDDHAFTIQGLIDLYETCGAVQYLRRAVGLMEQVVARFSDPEGEGFFETAGDDPSLIVRMKEHHDGAEPAGSSVTVWSLLRLGELTNRPEWRDRATRVFRAEGKLLASQPVTLPMMTAALGQARSPWRQVVILGPGADERTRALREEVCARFLSDTAVHLVEPGAQQEELAEILPFAGTLTMAGGRPAAFVCRDYACELPSFDPEDLGKQLDG